MTEEREDDLRPLIELYHPPPDFPADSLWAGFEASGAGAKAGNRTRAGRQARTIPLSWAAAAAVVLFVGGGLAGYRLVDSGRVSSGEAASENEFSAPSSVELSADESARHVIWF